MELRDTISMMESDDFKERFRAEYFQTKIRYDKLHKLIIQLEAGTAPFEPKCSLELFKKQAVFMEEYLYCLEVRAEVEGVDLD